MKKEQIKEFVRLNLKDKCYVFFRAWDKFIFQEYQKKYNFMSKYRFINRSKNNKKLLIVLAGYKEFLWDNVFKRIASFVDKDIDVCIISCGLFSEKLKQICDKNKWSYLSTTENKVAVGQNLAIKIHPEAEVIYKLDEDIFIGKNFFKNLYKTYELIKKENIYKINFIAPILNVNTISYLNFLEKIGKLKEYENKFDEKKVDILGTSIWNNLEAAKFIWMNTLPFDKTNSHFSKEKPSYEIIPFRFSIGAILFEREWWKEIGGFRSGWAKILGGDEESLIIEGVKKGRASFLSKNTFAGHFSYGPQNHYMKEYYQKNKKLFEINK